MNSVASRRHEPRWASAHAALTLLAAERVPRARWRDEYHAMPVGAPVGLLACLLIAAAPALVGWHIVRDDVWVSTLGWVLLPPMLLVATAVPLWIARLLWAETRAAVRHSNWQVRLCADAVYVNLRSWRNWRLPAASWQAVRIPWDAIASVQGVHEEWRVLPRAGVRRRFKSYVALRLHPDVDTTLVREAAHAEVRRVLLHPGFVRSSAVWNEVPVFVHEGDVYIFRVEMSLLRALARRVPRQPRSAAVYTVGPEFLFQPAGVEGGQLAALVLRGEWNLAQMSAQFRMGMRYDDSVAFIRELFSPGRP